MRKVIAVICFALTAATPVFAQTGTVWDRHDPRMAYLTEDFRARRVGDIITIMIDESTGIDSQEKREMNKTTEAGLAANGNGSSTSLGKVLNSFAGDLTLGTTSKRKLDGKANSSTDRKFTDKLSVTVVAVLPNGNLVIEGYRQRILSREVRTLRIMGLVRPVDIGPYNTVQSQYIANLFVTYVGRGPESSYTNQGFGGRIFNVIWPF